MITDMMDIHDGFFAKFEGAITIDDVAVSSRFFNPQPSQKKAPTYPSIVIQPHVPRPSSRVWVESTSIYNAEDGTAQEVKPPKLWKFPYQVSMYSARFDHAIKLFQAVHGLFPEVKGQSFIKIESDNYDVVLVDERSVPTIDAGVFRYDFDYEVHVPVYALAEEAVKAIETWSVATEETTSNLSE